MYLHKKTYVGAYHEHSKITGKIEIKQGGKTLPISFNRISEITEQVGYWRKANAIHKWFVDHVQDGNDDCGEYEVSYEQLQELLDVCKRVLKSSKLAAGEQGRVMKDASVAEQLLPTTDGFFFGATEYNQYYLDDIESTIQIVETVLDELDESKKQDVWPASIHYQSSW